jgi:hypothetical protein
MIRIDMNEQVFHGRVAGAINRLNNMVTVKLGLMERLTNIALPRAVGVDRERLLSEIQRLDEEIGELRTVANDIRFIREAA